MTPDIRDLQVTVDIGHNLSHKRGLSNYDTKQ